MRPVPLATLWNLEDVVSTSLQDKIFTTNNIFLSLQFQIATHPVKD